MERNRKITIGGIIDGGMTYYLGQKVIGGSAEISKITKSIDEYGNISYEIFIYKEGLGNYSWKSIDKGRSGENIILEKDTNY